MKRRVFSRRRLVLGATGLTCAVLVAPALAGAAVIGPPDLESKWDGSRACGLDPAPCEFVNLRLPTGDVRSPVTGTITKWRVNIEEFSGTGEGPVQLQVLRRTVNEPGRPADEFRAVRESSEEDTGINVNTFFASLKIRKGDFIGLNLLGENTSIRQIDAGVVGIFETPLTAGDPAAPFDDFLQERQMLFNATVKN